METSSNVVSDHAKEIYQQRMAEREAAKQKVVAAYEQGKYGNHKFRFVYSCPVTMHTSRYRSKTDSVHTVGKIFKYDSYYCYAPNSNSRRGWEIGTDDLVSITVIQKKADLFNSLDEFAKRFDKRFITDEEITRLWESKSNQHGNQYRPSDFRRVSKVMKEKVKQFAETVKDIRPLQDKKNTPQGFVTNEYGVFCTVDHQSWHHTGRDIEISYKLGHPFVWYKSEFHRCGNGSYGILATESTWLHLEDD
jgi:hypothetical protein